MGCLFLDAEEPLKLDVLSHNSTHLLHFPFPCQELCCHKIKDCNNSMVAASVREELIKWYYKCAP